MLKMKEFDVMEGGRGGLPSETQFFMGPSDETHSSLSSSWDLVTNMFITNSLLDET